LRPEEREESSANPTPITTLVAIVRRTKERGPTVIAGSFLSSKPRRPDIPANGRDGVLLRFDWFAANLAD
jgi:hypothetical protein